MPDIAHLPSPFGVLATVWTARFAVACYVGRLAVDAWQPRDAAWQRLARGIWTVGAILFALHVAAAMEFYHQGSHSAAWEHVRRETLAKTGWDSGVGLLLNDLFVAVWSIETLLWWRDETWPQRRGIYVVCQLFYAFLIVNATAIFGPGFWVPVAVLAVVGLLSLWQMARQRPLGSVVELSRTVA